MEPDVHVLSYNVGLTNDQADPEKTDVSSVFYKFSTQLTNVIQRMFTRGADTPAADAHALDARSAGADTPSTPAHVVCLCELGSQFRCERIDAVLEKRSQRSLPLSIRYREVSGLCNLSGSLEGYLCELVKKKTQVSSRSNTSCGPAPHTQQSTTAAGSRRSHFTPSSRPCQPPTGELQS